MAPVNRKVTYRLYPTPRQEQDLLAMKQLHQQLYNAALEQRIFAYRQLGRSVSFQDQCKELRGLREYAEYSCLNAQSCQVTLKRLDLAFAGFFRRVARGETPGFPRFKARERFKGWGYKSHGDGFKLLPGGPDKKGRLAHGRLKLSGVGELSLRGRARTQGEPKTCEITHNAGRWYASVTLPCRPVREKGQGASGLDWGVQTQATLVHEQGSVLEAENSRHFRKALQKLAALQQQLARAKKGSKRRQKLKNQIARLHQKIANQRLDYLHQLCAFLVTLVGLIATEKLNVKGMTGAGGSHKRGLNREILASAPALFLQLLRYKAEEAGIEWVEVPTKKVKPSQTCSGCGRQEKKELSCRVHRCSGCGLVLGRDENAAKVMMLWALGQLPQAPPSREPARRRGVVVKAPSKRETPPIPAHAGWVG
jgi:putative transposase